MNPGDPKVIRGRCRPSLDPLPASARPRPSVRVAQRRLLSRLLAFALVLPFPLAFSNAVAAPPPEVAASAAETTRAAMALLRAECFGCHSEAKARGGLNLSRHDTLLRGSDNGPVLDSAQPADSRLLQVLDPAGDPHMPPKKQLGTGEIATLRAWIESGADWDAAELARLDRPREVRFEPPPASHHPVLALAFSSDATRLALGRGRHLILHDATTNAFPRLLECIAHADFVRAIAWSPDGRWLATGGFREITVWTADTLQPVWSLDAQLAGRITALKFSPHGGALLAGDSPSGAPAWVRIYQATNGTPIAAWPAHDDTIFDIDLSPDGGILATAGADRFAKTWELLTGRELARIEGHAGAVHGLAFHPNGRELVTVGADRQLKLWDLATRESVVAIASRQRAFQAVAWSRDASRIVAGGDDGGLISFTDFKRHTGEQSSATASEKSLAKSAQPLHAVALSADGQRIAAGDDDGVAQIVDAQGKLLARLTPDSSATPASAAAAATPAAVETPSSSPPPSFVHDVLPMLAKAGCSAGSCHAKADGQNGFKLSVFSYDPQADFAEIVKEGRGRRLFPAAPAESLLLLKSTATVPHTGGRRISPGSPEEALLLAWIRGGMTYRATNEPTLARIEIQPREGLYSPGQSAPLRVVAHYDNAASRDITTLAEYQSNDRERVEVDDLGVLRIGQLGGESVVVARFMGFVDATRVTVPLEQRLPAERYAHLPVHNFIDRLAHDQFQKLGLLPSDLCTDSEFLRRSSLDTLGVLPTPAEAREFLAAAALDSRAARSAWIERLLNRPEFADAWANRWADLVRPNPDRVGVKSVFVLDQWLREAFRSDLPYDQFVRNILLVEGSNHRDGPAVIFRDRRDPPELTTLFSQLFLGVRMECAKCHHHPNEKWSQDDFYQFAAVFGSVGQKGAGLSPPISAGTETFFFRPGGSVRHPVTGAVMPPRPPDGPVLHPGPQEDPRHAFAAWLTSPDNPYFARAAVNRVWAVFFGRGFVDPVDDFRISNPPSNAALLDALADDFSRHGYRLKHLVRTILQSRLYQLSSTPNALNLADTRNFARAYRRRLPAEVLLDAVNDITGVGDDFNGCPPGTRAMQTWSYKVRSHFLDAFGRPNSSSDCPCERESRPSVVQALHLMNSSRLQEKLASSQGRVHQLAESSLSPAQIIEELYLATFSRPPHPEESARALQAFSAPDASRQRATEDVLWALLNTAEFVFNH